LPNKDPLANARKDEMFSDDVMEYARKVCGVKNEVEVLIAKREVYAAPTFSLRVPFKDAWEQITKVRSWLIEKF
jgi:hypothetical protein